MSYYYYLPPLFSHVDHGFLNALTATQYLILPISECDQGLPYSLALFSSPESPRI